MKLILKAVIVIFFITAPKIVFCQSYSLILDTVNITSYSFEPIISIEENSTDSLSFEISFYSFYDADSVLMFEETFDINNPKIESFKSINFNHTSNLAKLVLMESDIVPFKIFVRVKKSGAIIEEITFD